MNGPDAPTFTVVVATYARGTLIEATLQSIADQELRAFEVLVVSDGPTAAGLAETVGRFDDRFQLAETPVRGRSQSGPNNLGWARARGRYVAYLGHDDIWHPTHLRQLADTFERNPDASFAVSGCMYFGPPGRVDDLLWVTGMFDSGDTTVPNEHFFPPSSVSHKRELPPEVERWQDAATLPRPVDVEFLQGAVRAGCRFGSTGTITVFKFASALRYLSYLSPDDWEQRWMLELIARPSELDEFVAAKLSLAKKHGNVMAMTYREDEVAPGVGLERNEHTRGIAIAPVENLAGSAWISAGEDPRGSDWYGLETGGGTRWRWSGPNHRPRLVIPYTHDEPVRVRVHVTRFATEEVRSSLAVAVNREPVDSVVEEGPEGYVISFVTRLRPDRPSVLELRTSRAVPATGFPSRRDDQRLVGLCLAGIELEPERSFASRGGATAEESLAYVRHALEEAIEERDRALEEVRVLRASGSWRYTGWYRRLGDRLRRRRP